MRFRRDLADHPAALPHGQRRVGGLPDQPVPEQRHLLGARRPLPFLLSPVHGLSFLS